VSAGARRAASSSPPAPPRRSPIDLGWRLADGYLAAAALLALELAVVAAARSGEFAAFYEITFAFQTVYPIALVVAAPAGVIAGAFAELVLRADRRSARVAVALVAAAFGAAVGYGVSGGRHLEGGLRAPFVIVVALGAGVAAYAASAPLARWTSRPRGAAERAASAVGAALAIVGLELANVCILPRLYEAFHAGLAALAILAAPFVARLASGPRAALGNGRVVRAALALVVFAASAARATRAAEELAPADNVRIVVATHAPLLRYAVELAAAMSPPSAQDDAGDREPLPAGASVPLAGRDVLLVTIDALRADHVGAYGYGRPTTPSLDRLAAEGVVFERAYSQTPHTSYAVTSLMTGKYMRPLLLQGIGQDSETWAAHLRRYGFRTAAFYPPAVFFIDADRFEPMRRSELDFEYAKVEFAPAPQRVEQVREYLATVPDDARVFLWVHLFEPHEPYEARADHAFGDRDLDRYDGEIAAADAGLGALVDLVRGARPDALVVVAADHGEEFLEHGGRYHGTTVYEEQVRVPLVLAAKGLLAPRRVAQPVQLVDLLPTVLAGLDVPRPARVRGADLGPYLLGAPLDPERERGFAFAESETQTLVARGPLRLVCERRIGACALYDVERDPAQASDVAAARPAEVASLRAELRAFEASHGRYETRGLRAEGKGWPEALRRGIAGDADAAADVAVLLDDADVANRRKAAEVLFDLKRPETAADLRLALLRDEDDEVRRYAALALTRLGEGAPRVRELLDDSDQRFRRLAALALAETGDARGERVLVAWLRAAHPPSDADEPRRPEPIPFEREKELIAALGRVRAKASVRPLIDALGDVRARPYAARALGEIGEDAARPALAAQLASERYHTARVAIVDALVKLGAGPELRQPLVFLLGVPDPLPDGLAVAERADLLESIGGPRKRDLARLRRFATSGVAVGLTVPKGGSGAGVRVLCRVKSTDARDGEVRVGLPLRPTSSTRRGGDGLVPADAPAIDPARSVALAVRGLPSAQEVFATLPASMAIAQGEHRELVVYATHNVAVSVCAVVPRSDELPPPPPEPWSPVGLDPAPAADGQSPRSD
jgi:arylsulfatase A-like enzyme